MYDPTCEWDEQESIRLIREYKVRPALWDTTHQFYYKKPMKLELWKEIGHALNKPMTACRHKMLVLMSSLRREKARIRNSRLGSGGKPYNSRWFAFKEMKFLMQKHKIRKYGQIDEEYQQEDDDGNEQETSSITLHENKNTINTIADTLESEAPHKITRRVKSNNEKEVRAFADFIAAKMMKYSESTKNAVQQAICDIIFKADTKSYKEQDTSGMQEEEIDQMNESDGHGVKDTSGMQEEEIDQMNESDGHGVKLEFVVDESD